MVSVCPVVVFVSVQTLPAKGVVLWSAVFVQVTVPGIRVQHAYTVLLLLPMCSVVPAGCSVEQEGVLLHPVHLYPWWVNLFDANGVLPSALMMVSGMCPLPPLGL